MGRLQPQLPRSPLPMAREASSSTARSMTGGRIARRSSSSFSSTSATRCGRRRRATPEDVQRAANMIERTLRVQAMRYHARGQREKQAADFEQAAALYGLHVTHFPNAPQAYEMSFYLGEIQFHRNKDYARHQPIRHGCGSSRCSGGWSCPSASWRRCWPKPAAGFASSQDPGRCRRPRAAQGGQLGVPDARRRRSASSRCSR